MTVPAPDISRPLLSPRRCPGRHRSVYRTNGTANHSSVAQKRRRRPLSPQRTSLQGNRPLPHYRPVPDTAPGPLETTVTPDQATQPPQRDEVIIPHVTAASVMIISDDESDGQNYVEQEAAGGGQWNKLYYLTGSQHQRIGHYSRHPVVMRGPPTVPSRTASIPG